MKLNKHHKEEIVRKVLDVKFPKSKLDEILKELGTQLRMEMQDDIIDGWEKYDKYINTSSTIYFYYGCVENSGNTKYKPLNVKMFPINQTSSKYRRVQDKTYKYDTHRLISKEASKISNRYLKQLREYNDFKLELFGALSSINTDKQLKEHLPKLVKFLPIDKQCGLVPVSTFKSINKKLKDI